MGDAPLFIFYLFKGSRKCVEADASKTCASNAIGEEGVVTSLLSSPPHAPKNSIQNGPRNESQSASSNKYWVRKKKIFLKTVLSCIVANYKVTLLFKISRYMIERSIKDVQTRRK